MKFGQIIRQYRDAEGISLREFAAKSGLSPAYVSMVEHDRNPRTGEPIRPSIETYRLAAQAMNMTTGELLALVDDDVSLEAVAATAPARPATPTMSERGRRVGLLYDLASERDRRIVDMTLEPYEERLGSEPPRAEIVELRARRKRRNTDGFVEIEVFEDQLPAAGYSAYFDRPRSHAEQYPDGIVPEKATFGVIVGGNSMEPQYANHATAFIESAPRIESGEVGLFSLNGEPYIKQLIVDAERREVRLHSFNPEYADIIVQEFDDLRTFGRVLGSY